MRRPDALDGARVLGLGLLVFSGIHVLAGVFGPFPFAGLLIPLSFLLIPILYARRVGLPPLAASGFTPLRWRSAILVVCASLGSLWLLHGLAQLQAGVFEWAGLEGVAEREERQIRDMIDAIGREGLGWAIALLVVAPALCEETLFRGIVLRGFAAGFGSVRALLITSVLFSLMHGTYLQLAMTFVLGVYFGSLVLLTRSLWAGILAHGLNNLAVVVASLLAADQGERVDDMTAPWWMYVLSALIFTGAMTALARQAPPPGPSPGGGSEAAVNGGGSE